MVQYLGSVYAVLLRLILYVQYTSTTPLFYQFSSLSICFGKIHDGLEMYCSVYSHGLLFLVGLYLVVHDTVYCQFLRLTTVCANVKVIILYNIKQLLCRYDNIIITRFEKEKIDTYFSAIA